VEMAKSEITDAITIFVKPILISMINIIINILEMISLIQRSCNILIESLT
jgi:hypothetical protein